MDYKEEIDFSNRLKKNTAGGNPEQEWRRHIITTELPKLVRLVMTYSGGLIQNTKQAVYVLWMFVMVAVIVTLFMLSSSRSGSPPPVPSITGTPIEKTY